MFDGTVYYCGKCGYCIGLGSGKGDVSFKIEEQIKEGKYGKRAKSIVLKNPSSTIHGIWEIFVCSCGWYRYAPVSIECCGRVAKTTIVRCDCGRKMRPLEKGEKLVCYKCGEEYTTIGSFDIP